MNKDMKKETNFFTEGRNNIYYIGSNFSSLFQPCTPERADLKVAKLKRPMTNREILEEWGPEVVTLGNVAYAMENAEKVGLLKNGYANIFYVNDKDGVLRAVGVNYDAGSGWYVDARTVDNPLAWGAGHEVVSRNFSDSESFGSIRSSNSSVPLTLGPTWDDFNGLADRLEKIEKVLRSI